MIWTTLEGFEMSPAEPLRLPQISSAPQAATTVAAFVGFGHSSSHEFVIQ
jgi:hypothetical protein